VRLSLVVPATDDPPTLDRCLDAVRAAQDPPDETVVVTSPLRSGPAAARNAGADRATGDVVVFVDADVLVHPDAFTRIRAAFAADSGLVAVFGSYDDLVVTDGVVAGFRNVLHHTVHQRSAGSATTFWAGLGAVRSEAFLAVGGFDAERYCRASIEDIELGGRLAGEGRLVLDPGLQGTHLKEWTLRSMVATDFACRGVPWVALMAERRAVPATLNLGPRERASMLAALAGAAAVAMRRPRGALVFGVATVALNADLYATLGRRLRVRGVALGLPLHVLHQLVALAAVPAGLLVASTRRPRRQRRDAPR
jgi:Glycosyl transferase family 2